MGLCGDYGPSDFKSACIRASWSAFVPAAIVFFLCLCSVPVPRPARRIFAIIGSPFRTYLTLHEAEAIDINVVSGDKVLDREEAETVLEISKVVPLWRTVVFAFVGIVESFCWVAYGSYQIYNDPDDICRGVLSFLLATSWLYTVVRPIARPTATSPQDMFALYLALLSGAILQLGGVLFDHSVLEAPLPSKTTLFGLITNLLVIVVLLGMVVSMPLDIPSIRVDVKEIVSVLS